MKIVNSGDYVQCNSKIINTNGKFLLLRFLKFLGKLCYHGDRVAGEEQQEEQVRSDPANKGADCS